MVPIHDKVYIVTGGGGAIAAAVLAELRAAGARLAVVDRTEEHARRGATTALAAGRAESGSAEGDKDPVIALAADLGRPDSAVAMVDTCVEHFGRVDGLVHTVGGFAMGGVAGSEAGLYDRMFDVNVRTLLHCVGAVLPRLLAQRDGFICGFSSEPAISGRAPGSALYGAAKSAVASILHSLDAELAGSPVRVAIVYPMGAVDTAANRRDMPDADPAAFIDPQAIGEAIVFAATRSARGRMVDFPIFPARKPHFDR